MGWFLKQSLMSPLYVSHHQRRIEWDLENLQTDCNLQARLENGQKISKMPRQEIGSRGEGKELNFSIDHQGHQGHQGQPG